MTAKSIPKKSNAGHVISRVSSQTFTKTVMRTRYVGFVASDTVRYTMCKRVGGSGARNMTRGIVRYVLVLWAQSSSNVEMLAILQLELKGTEWSHS